MTQGKILERLHSLGIPALLEVDTLHELNGGYINLECRLPNGKMGKLLNDSGKYFANQVCKKGSDRCYGIAADENQLAVYEYGCEGADAVLVAWVRL